MSLEKESCSQSRKKFWPVGAQLIRGWARAHLAP